MTKYVKDPDGNIHQFDDNATPDQIHAQMSNYWTAKQNAPAPAGIPGAKPGGMQPLEGAPDLTMVPLSDEAEQLKHMSIVGGLLGNRALATSASNLYEHDPTQMARQAAGTGAGKAATELAARRSAGYRIMPGIDALRDMIDKTDEQTWKLGAGPYNAQVMRPEVEFSMHPTAWKAPEMTPAQARRIWGMGMGIGNDPNSEANIKAWKLQNDLEHLTGALTDQYIASAGGAAAVNSDAKMKIFLDMMRKAMFANDKEGAHDILNTAEDAARNVFALDARRGTAGKPIPLPMTNDPEVIRKTIARFRKGTYFETPDGQIKVKE